MDIETTILCITAGSVALVHTLLGPDHYLPFIAMSRAGRWSLRRTLLVTLACGLGHVLSSVAVGAVGVTLGISLLSVETFESSRGKLPFSTTLSANLRETRNAERIRVGRRQRNQECWDYENE